MWGSWYFLRFLLRDGSIRPDEHGLFDNPGDAVNLPVHKGETVGINSVPCGLAVLVDGE